MAKIDQRAERSGYYDQFTTWKISGYTFGSLLN